MAYAEKLLSKYGYKIRRHINSRQHMYNVSDRKHGNSSPVRLEGNRLPPGHSHRTWRITGTQRALMDEVQSWPTRAVRRAP